MPRKNLGGGYTRSIIFSVVATLIYLESAAGWSENSPDLVDTLTNRGDGEDFQACNDQQFTCADSGNCIDKVGIRHLQHRHFEHIAVFLNIFARAPK